MTVAVIGQVREYRQIASPNTVVDLAPLIVHAPRMPVSSIWRQGPLASPDATHSKTRSGRGPSSRRRRFRKEMLAQSYSEERRGGAATSVGRGRLDENGSALSGFEVIFRQEPAVSGRNHFGSRLAFALTASSSSRSASASSDGYVGVFRPRTECRFG
jgi:glucose/arabinose dehydrogenase